MTKNNEFLALEVSHDLKITPRQLQWWDEQKVICPRHEAHRRLYSIQEVVALSAIKQLRDRGLSLQAIRRILRSLRKQLDPMVPAIVGGATALIVVNVAATQVSIFVAQVNALVYMTHKAEAFIIIAVGPELWKILPTGGKRIEVA